MPKMICLQMMIIAIHWTYGTLFSKMTLLIFDPGFSSVGSWMLKHKAMLLVLIAFTLAQTPWISLKLIAVELVEK